MDVSLKKIETNVCNLKDLQESSDEKNTERCEYLKEYYDKVLDDFNKNRDELKTEIAGINTRIDLITM